VVPSFDNQIIVRGGAAVTFATAAVLAFLPESAVTQEALVEKAQFTFGVLTTIFAALLKLPEQYRFKLLDRFAGGGERDQVFTGLACAALAVASVSFFIPGWADYFGVNPEVMSTVAGGSSAVFALLVGNTSSDDHS
jgi:hypothetical protein